MAQKLRDINVDDFTGGLVGDKSDYQMNKNELKDLRNFDVDNRGKLKKRGGYQLFGTALSGTLDYAASFVDPSVFTAGQFLVFDRGTNAKAYQLVTTSLESTLSPGDTTATVGSNSSFLASGTFEVDGDIVTYTSKPSGTSFAITTGTLLAGKTHIIGTGVRQYLASANTGVNSTSGIYGTMLGGTYFVFGYNSAARASTLTLGSLAFSAVTASSIIFAVTYRERIFGAGSGAGTNGGIQRVSFSNAGDGTTWDTTNNWFDVNDSRNEAITGLRPFNDRLLIFKLNSIFTYDEIQLKQSETDIGAYNHHVIQEIDDTLYTFCPAGVYATNGSSSKKISAPVEHILKAYFPRYDTTNGRVINNCFAGKYDKKYILYLGDTLLFPDPLNRDGSKLQRNVALVYDTEMNNWTIYNFSTSFNYFLPSSFFTSGGNATTGNQRQAIETMFGLGATDVFRMFSNFEVGFDTSLNVIGSDIYADNINNSVGVEISALAESPLLDAGNPSWWKRFGYVRSLSATGDFNLSYRLDKGDHVTDWISLGVFRKPNERIKLPDTEGYRIALKVTTYQGMNISESNGFVIEEIEAISKQSRRNA